VNKSAWLWAVLIVAVPLSPAEAGLPLVRRGALERINRRIQGQVVDFTHNHGADRRIWSEALHQQRDLYVYLPPHFDPQQQYPLMIWLHGFAQDEQAFLEYAVEPLDHAITSGQLPPLIVAAPDGSLKGEPCMMSAGSFFVNSNAGNFEDFIMQDVWNFLFLHFPIRPEREAHVLAGVSMGGGAAYDLAIKYRDRVKVVFGIFPPLNIRWLDCHCRYTSKFNPDCWAWRTDFSKRFEVVGRFYVVIKVYLRRVIRPLYDKDPDIAGRVSSENPIELIDRLDLREGELSMYVAYGGKDQFNLAAQVESFLYVAEERGLTVAVNYDPKGKHDVATALRLYPGTIAWLAPLIAPYSPPLAHDHAP
jgi:S-formylglutathione hydrolase FrmB